MCASGANLSKDLVQPHLFSQDADVVKEVRLHVAPHVRKPPEIHSVLQQHVVSPILLISPCKRTHARTQSIGKTLVAISTLNTVSL